MIDCTAIMCTAVSFIASLGVTTHVHYPRTAYANLRQVESDLAYLGILHVRDVPPTPDGSNFGRYTSLVAHGVSFDMQILQDANLPGFISSLNRFVSRFPGRLKAIEGANEVNAWPVVYKGIHGLAGAVALQKALHAAVKADPLLADIPVYNTTLGGGSAAQYAQLGDLSAYTDFGNVHIYPQGNASPADYLAVNIAQQTKGTPGRPTVITEGGYYTMPDNKYGVTESVQARYTLDFLFDAVTVGARMTYLYELLDERPDSGNTDMEQHFGLFRNDHSPKPVADAIHALTAILADPEQRGAIGGGLAYMVHDMPPFGHSLQLVKHNGAVDIVVWAEPMIWQQRSRTQIAAPVSNVTLTFAAVQRRITIYDPLVGATPISTTANTGFVELALTDHPLIIEIAAVELP